MLHSFRGQLGPLGVFPLSSLVLSPQELILRAISNKFSASKSWTQSWLLRELDLWVTTYIAIISVLVKNANDGF